MEFKTFENKSNPFEYLQIFAFDKIENNKHIDIEIDDYKGFVLTDKLIESFNSWIATKEYDGSTTQKWLESNPIKVEYFIANFNSKFKPKVAIWSDREKPDYYIEQLQKAFDFENYIAKLIAEKYNLDLGQYLTPEGQYELGENALGIEIKNDTLISKYGNIYIEYQEKSKGSNYAFVNSGILKTDNCVYILIGSVEQFYIFRKDTLIQIYNEEIECLKKGIKSNRHISFKQIATSKGFVYPVRYAIKDTISIDTMIEEIKLRLNLK